MTDLHVQILNIEQAESEGWDSMVAEHPFGSVYQHTAFGKVIASTFGHVEPYYIALLDEGGSYVGGLVLFLVKSWLTGNRLVSIPWACYGDPMTRSVLEFEILFREVLELSRQVKASYVEIKARNSTGLLADANLMIPVYYNKSHFLDLTKGLNAVWDGFHRRSIKQKIRTAERNGIRVHFARSEQEVISFYQIFRKNRKRLGLPPQKLEYFQNIWKYMVPRGLAYFLVAQKQDQLIGGLCNFTFKETIFLSYVATEELLHRCGTGQYLFWATIRDASEKGLKTVDFGKTPQYADGLTQYKKKWGVGEMEAPVFYYPRVKGVSSHEDEHKLLYRAMRSFWKVAPPRLSRIASRFFYRHTG